MQNCLSEVRRSVVVVVVVVVAVVVVAPEPRGYEHFSENIKIFRTTPKSSKILRTPQKKFFRNFS